MGINITLGQHFFFEKGTYYSIMIKVNNKLIFESGFTLSRTRPSIYTYKKPYKTPFSPNSFAKLYPQIIVNLSKTLPAKNSESQRIHSYKSHPQYSYICTFQKIMCHNISGACTKLRHRSRTTNSASTTKKVQMIQYPFPS